MDVDALPQHHRTGAHRARRQPLRSAVLALAAVGAVSALLLWALLSLDVLGVGDDLREAGGVALSQQTEQQTAAGAVATTGGASPAVEPSVAPQTPATVDRSQPLRVLNSTGTPGLAATAAGALQLAGWSTAAVGNYDGAETLTTVLHPDEASASAAQAVVADLGVGAPQLSSDVTEVTVVLGPDYVG